MRGWQPVEPATAGVRLTGQLACVGARAGGVSVERAVGCRPGVFNETWSSTQVSWIVFAVLGPKVRLFLSLAKPARVVKGAAYISADGGRTGEDGGRGRRRAAVGGVVVLSRFY